MGSLFTGQTDSTMRGLLESGKRRAYILAGKATITVQGKTDRFTYRIVKSIPTDQYPDIVHWVGVLTGPDNTKDYHRLGMITADGKFIVLEKFGISRTAPSARAFDWISRNMEHPTMDVWHEGSCGKCGKKLTVITSIARGLGPKCAGDVGIAA